MATVLDSGPLMRRAAAMPAGSVFVLLALGWLMACEPRGQQQVRYPLEAGGAGATTTTLSGWQVELEEAQLAFGPVYFCATAAASSDLCPVAVQELAQVVVVDAVVRTPNAVGEVTGVTGSIRSATYDYGISWFTTYRQPRAAAVAPGGHSAQFVGRASKEGVVVRFRADIDVVPQLAGELAIQGVRLEADLQEPPTALTVTFDAAGWWSAVDFAPLAAGGSTEVVIAAGSPAYNAVVTAMTAGRPPAFRWR
jgi:hypothetical protein